MSRTSSSLISSIIKCLISDIYLVQDVSLKWVKILYLTISFICLSVAISCHRYDKIFKP
jgi:hypothetical protein